MKGWVYVISNKAMQGLVKVGYSSKDPDLRAGELNHTGSPHPYVVDYDVLVEDPRAIEQRAHRILSSSRENKEWFRCSPEEAIAAIKQAAGGTEITESYKRAERVRAEGLHRQALRDREQERKATVARQEFQARLAKDEAAIRKAFDESIERQCPPRPFWQYWITGGVIVFFLIGIVAPKTTDGAAIVSAVFWAVLPGWGLFEFFENRRKMSARYREFEQERDRKIALSRSQLEVQADRSTSAAGALDGSMPREIRREQPFDYQGPSIWGNPSALVQRGLDYMNGCGLPHSDADAVDCFRAAAKQGSAEGQYYLGWMYKLGRGIPADPIKAYMWLSLATWHGEPRASSFCRALEEQMTPAQLSTARSMSKTCQASNYEHCD